MRFHFWMRRFDECQQESSWSNKPRRNCRTQDHSEQFNRGNREHATVCGDGNWYSEYGSHVESRWWSGLQRRGMWYDFGRRDLQRTGECTLSCECQCDRDQRGRPNQISFGERYACSGGGCFTKH